MKVILKNSLVLLYIKKEKSQLGVIIMTMVERLLISEDEKVCCNCKYFWQHYIYNKHYECFQYCNAGHCVKPRVKDRKPNHKACEHFEKKRKLK